MTQPRPGRRAHAAQGIGKCGPRPPPSAASEVRLGVRSCQMGPATVTSLGRLSAAGTRAGPGPGLVIVPGHWQDSSRVSCQSGPGTGRGMRMHKVRADGPLRRWAKIASGPCQYMLLARTRTFNTSIMTPDESAGTSRMPLSGTHPSPCAHSPEGERRAPWPAQVQLPHQLVCHCGLAQAAQPEASGYARALFTSLSRHCPLGYALVT